MGDDVRNKLSTKVHVYKQERMEASKIELSGNQAKSLVDLSQTFPTSLPFPTSARW